jgi:L-2,4-diaminobutyric acid acetyltransferase
MHIEANVPTFTLRNFVLCDVGEVYNLLIANRPYVGLNSRYTYFLLARDFSDTCIVAEASGRIVGFSSGYIPPNRQDTFFSWEIVVHREYRGNGMQKKMLLHQLKRTKVKYLEGTVNPSNEISSRNFNELAKLLNADCKISILFSEEDFANDGHEAEMLVRIGPFCLENFYK